MGSFPSFIRRPEKVSEEVDVVIVGGGPTGLFAGLLLDRLGVSVCIIDAKPASLDLGRADALNARTQQYFEVANLLDDLLPQGLKCNTSSTFGNGEFLSRQSHWWTSLEHTLHKNFLMIGQPAIEALLSSHLTGKVRYGERVVSISEDSNAVSVTTDKGSVVTAKYAIGADGARSTIRQALSIPFTGTKPNMVWAVMDVFIETDFPQCPEIITFELNGKSRVSWIPRERGLARFYVMLDDGGEVTLERALASLKEHLAPHSMDFREVEWYSTFDVKERIAASFFSSGGRVVLAGDAAHVHSVNGGQGLNTGIADAFALAWRLALVLRSEQLDAGKARDVLGSYDLERRTIAEDVIDVAAKLVRATAQDAKGYVSTIEKKAGYITGMGVSYRGMASPLVHASQHGIWRSGDRCPDVLLSLPSGEEKWLYAAASYGKHLILGIGGGVRAGPKYEHVATVYNIVASESSVDGEDAGSTSVFKANWLAEDERAVVVVRPDMYIGYVGTEPDSWEGYFEGMV